MRITSPCSSTRPTVRHRPKRFLITACWSLAKLGLPRGARGVTRKRVAERRDCGVNMSLAGGFAHCCFCRCWYSAPIPWAPTHRTAPLCGRACGLSPQQQVNVVAHPELPGRQIARSLGPTHGC